MLEVRIEEVDDDGVGVARGRRTVHVAARSPANGSAP